jgi:hypothetical protein
MQASEAISLGQAIWHYWFESLSPLPLPQIPHKNNIKYFIVPNRGYFIKNFEVFFYIYLTVFDILMVEI